MHILNWPNFSDGQKMRMKPTEVREPYQVIQTMDMEGFFFSEMPVVSTHPDNQFHHLHYNQLPVIHEQFSLLAMRAQKRQPFHVYTDGSCMHPAHETTRCSIIVNSPRPIQNLAFSWGGLPGKVAPTCVYLLWSSCVR